MRYKYRTRAFTLGRYPLGEANASITLLTDEFGVIRARAQGLRRPASKMTVGLQTLAESDIMLVRGKEGWRLVGTVLRNDWARTLSRENAARAGRIADLIRRLSQGEDAEPRLFTIFTAFVSALADSREELGEAAETLAALKALRVLGHDDGELSLDGQFSAATLASVAKERTASIARVNAGIYASGL